MKNEKQSSGGQKHFEVKRPSKLLHVAGSTIYSLLLLLIHSWHLYVSPPVTSQRVTLLSVSPTQDNSMGPELTSYLQGKTQPMDEGSRAEGTVAPPGLLCSLAWCQTWVCGVEQHVPVGTKPKQRQVFPLCLHLFTGVAGRLPPERSQEQLDTMR